ncbi:MAG: septal ring lytic transglycosylase RlpA family protein [Verrucomicrobiota bacterium]
MLSAIVKPAARWPSRWLLLGLTLVLSSCFSRPEGYKGYQTRSYNVRGGYYQPMSVGEALDFEETGICSWYNESRFLGLKRGRTSLGEKVMPWHLTGAHKTLPLPCVVKVTNLANGRTVKLRLNDRGPFIANRVLDVTPKAAKKLGFHDRGLTRVHLKVVSVGDDGYKKKRRRFLFF